MNFVRLLPVIFSFLLFGAHILRAGEPVLAAAWSVLLLLLAVRRWWVPPVMQALLAVAVIEWLRTLYLLVSMRLAFDMPSGRLVLILGAVAAFTALSALVFRLRALRRCYEAGLTARR